MQQQLRNLKKGCHRLVRFGIEYQKDDAAHHHKRILCLSHEIVLKRTSWCILHRILADSTFQQVEGRPASVHHYLRHMATSLKRAADPAGAGISSRSYVRSLKNGKVQKIVREVYLRQDIPCSSQLCKICQTNAPTDASGKGRRFQTYEE